MKIVIAIDSMKGSLSSLEAGNAAREGILRVCPDADVSVFPVADGGEGTVDALVSAKGGRIRQVTVSDPLGRKITASYGLLGDKKAVIEMSSAAGLPLLKAEERNPLAATTFGVGEMIVDAIGQGCTDFVIGIGGSATNDGGIGMLSALGFDLLDEKGNPVPFGAVGAEKIARISDAHVLPSLASCSFRVACDVTNPLCGENGCSAVFGRQKGADDKMIARMDAALARYAEIVKKRNPDADPAFPGAGAAGGIGFAFLSFLNAGLVGGIDLILRELKLEEPIANADFVITGEGKLDGQTSMGKTPVGVAKIAKRFGKPVIALAGCLADSAFLCREKGIDAMFPILRSPLSLSEAMEKETAAKNTANAAEEIFRLLAAVKKR